ncbi:hypothetical protein [Nostoc sp. MS1]|uniref:hypothetical protein n=1 Tax=Nostoc sp. MS1 TaxID=2764711 RepID=UPI001CC5D5CF|nr:hypothetical protein [Nostoc sp. MS1]BCL34424.1 hypothetical protein NSMS1_08710 [Nostoc sp. MS1]
MGNEDWGIVESSKNELFSPLRCIVKSSVSSIAAATLTLLLGFAANPVVALPNNQPQSLRVAQRSQSTDTLIVPGERVGPVTRTTTRKELARIFGASRLVDKTISGAEGIGSFAATQVNLNSDRSFLIVWTDTTRTKPSEVRDLGTAWKTREGIGVGTPWSELRNKLGNFKLYGLGWDYSGTILLESSKLSRYQGKLILRADAAPNAGNKYPNAYKAVSGDGTFSSSDRHWKPLGMRLAQVIVVLNPS